MKLINNIKKFCEEKPGKAALISLIAILLFAFLYWGFSHNITGDKESATGFQVLANEGGGFWLGIGIGAIAVGVLVAIAIKKIKKEGELDNFWAFWIAFGLFLAIAFGKGCSDKANEGVTSKGGRPVKIEKPDDNRLPAEDMLKKQ